ncbi:4Fe4S-binding SPASM domain [uncultured Caudovirales phage]|uniref:4Fe4S-binding SPASM domain n=1 Tax=uncultured Caudovirales phage TaxID=2100421 RepID=A0A6J5KM11_9CAUD|nr:4Fe4S-binding SPASM domain [uncultured Caudovirales phage]CAB4123746.1 4Fe4S-binding SPASM domain [uncultured Caudovirales phage]
MLNIFIGFACNLNCSYCLQAGEEDRTGSPRLRIDLFLERVVPIIKAQKIKKIAYWGGEPLLYWKHIKKIHDALLNEGLEFDFIKITTNGTLLDQEHVDDCNRWGAFVIVSRHKAFGTPKWEFVRKINYFSYSHVVTAREYILDEFLADLKNVEWLLMREVSPWINWVHATKGCSPNEYLSFDNARDHADHLMDLARRLVVTKDRHLGDMFYGHLAKWRAQMTRKQFMPKCFGDHQIDIDLEGNRYGCHHNVNKQTLIGRWEGKVESEKGLDLVHQFVNTDECKACPIRFWCRGNCHMSQTHAVDCYLSKRLHEVFTFLDAEWEPVASNPKFIMT